MRTPTKSQSSPWLGAVIWIGGGLLLLLVLTSVIQTRTLLGTVRDTQLEGTPLGKKLYAAADQIQSCTTPAGECYVESQKRTAKYLSQQSNNTRDIVIATQVCSDQGIRGTGPLTACVDKALGNSAKP